MSPAEVKMFSQRILAACGHVRNKRKNVHSGKKTNPAVLRIIRLLPEGSPKQASSSSLGSSSQPSLPLVDLESKVQPQAYVMDQNISKSLYKDFCGTVDFHEEGGESAVEIEDDIVISSEDEELESSLQPPKAVAWTSTKDMSLVRTSDSVLKYAKMRPGPNGFAIGQFSGSETEHPSEIPDSMLELHKKYDPEKIEAKKPAAKKAAAKKAAAKKAAAKKAAAKKGCSSQDGQFSSEICYTC